MASRFGETHPSSSSAVAGNKRRRYLSRSDDEIQQELDRKGLTYRAGWPDLAIEPLQTFVVGVASSIKNYRMHLNSVKIILDTQRIASRETYFAYRVPNDEPKDTEKSRYTTLVITTDTTVGKDYVTAITQIRHRFKDFEETKDVHIEIIDFRAVHGLNTMAIQSNDQESLELWPSLSSAVIAVINKLQEKWLVVELANRGIFRELENCHPTVIITSPTASNENWWTKVLPTIRQMLRERAPKFHLELLCGTTIFQEEYDNRSAHIDEDSYRRSVQMGASIGMHNSERGCGTLGGSVRLANNVTCALTNYHVVQDKYTDELIAATKHDGMLRPGNKVLFENPSRVNSPANYDNAGYLHQQRKELKHWADTTLSSPSKVKEMKSVIAVKIQAAEASRSLGVLSAASGRRFTVEAQFPTNFETGRPKEEKELKEQSKFHFLLDWALLDLVESRKVLNELPKKQRLADRYVKIGLFERQDCLTWSAMNDPALNARRNENVHIAKVGRTTGWTYGTIAPLLAEISPAIFEYDDMSKIYGFTENNLGRCYTVHKRLGAEEEQFLAAGDSGSIVVHDPSGSWVGLVFGRSAAGTGLMTAIETVFRDIERVTGFAVVEPRYRKIPVEK